VPRQRPSPGKQERTVRVTNPASLLAIIPHLLTFEPAKSLVLIGAAPPRAQVRVTLRYDLPDPPDPDTAMEIARHAMGVLRAQRIETAVAVGYGPGPLVTPVADALRERAKDPVQTTARSTVRLWTTRARPVNERDVDAIARPRMGKRTLRPGSPRQ
jgi:Domain of unknown function (DUF4192)